MVNINLYYICKILIYYTGLTVFICVYLCIFPINYIYHKYTSVSSSHGFGHSHLFHFLKFSILLKLRMLELLFSIIQSKQTNRITKKELQEFSTPYWFLPLTHPPTLLINFDFGSTCLLYYIFVPLSPLPDFFVFIFWENLSPP